MSDVTTRHPAYSNRLDDWQLMRDCFRGTRAVKDRPGRAGWAGTAYLPPLSGQTREDYEKYRDRAVFFNAVYRTIQAFKGMIFRKGPQVDAPPGIRAHFSDITLTGVSLERFARELVAELLVTGRAGIFIDHPPKPPGAGVIPADVKERLNLRPAWHLYSAENVVNWGYEPIGNRSALSWVVLREFAAARGPNRFDTARREQYRVLELADLGGGDGPVYRERVFRYDADARVWVEFETVTPILGGRPMDFIPFVFAGVGDDPDTPDRPLLLDLAELNLAHYRKTADLENGLHICGVPTPYAAGFDPGEDDAFHLGTSEAWIGPMGATAGFIEFTGQGTEAIERALERDEANMAKIGARVLAPEKKAYEAAETAAIRQAGDTSVLAALAGNAGETLTRALRIHAAWSGERDVRDCLVRLNTDFFPEAMEPDELRALLEGWRSGAYSYVDLFDILRAKGLLREGRSIDEVRGDLAEERGVA